VSFLADQAPAAARGRPKAPLALVPDTAVRAEGDQSVAFVLKGNSVERRAVKVGSRHGDRLEVIAGSTPGEQVVVEGPAGLATAIGSPVKAEK
jgi:multidrug efflux pump subunit AcrA (membrane-fusion protein)